MDPRDAMEPDQLESGTHFSEQLLACLEECAHGRRGLFSDVALIEDEQRIARGPRRPACANWHSRCRTSSRSRSKRNALCDEFLDLCSMHGESHPGEPRLARTVSCAHRARRSGHTN